MYLNPYVNPVVNLFIKAAETDLPEAARSTRELLQLSLESLKAPTCPFGRDLRQKLAEGTVNSSMTKMAVGCPAFGSPAFAGFMNWAKQARDLYMPPIT